MVCRRPTHECTASQENGKTIHAWFLHLQSETLLSTQSSWLWWSWSFWSSLSSPVISVASSLVVLLNVLYVDFIEFVYLFVSYFLNSREFALPAQLFVWLSDTSFSTGVPKNGAQAQHLQHIHQPYVPKRWSDIPNVTQSRTWTCLSNPTSENLRWILGRGLRRLSRSLDFGMDRQVSGHNRVVKALPRAYSEGIWGSSVLTSFDRLTFSTEDFDQHRCKNRSGADHEGPPSRLPSPSRHRPQAKTSLTMDRLETNFFWARCKAAWYINPIHPWSIHDPYHISFPPMATGQFGWWWLLTSESSLSIEHSPWHPWGQTTLCKWHMSSDCSFPLSDKTWSLECTSSCHACCQRFCLQMMMSSVIAEQLQN